MSDTKNVFQGMLARWGWKGIQIGQYTGGDGAVCSIQCLREENGTPADERLFLQAANELYPPVQGGKWTDIPVFNDTDGRTTDQLFRTAQRARELRNAGVG